MTGSRSSDPVRGVATRRGRGAVAASILAVVLLGGYFAASPGALAPLTGPYLIHAAVLAVAFWFPAVRIGSLAELRAGAPSLGVWILAWTFVWDLATSGILGSRGLLQEWWVVYPAGLLFLFGLLALHAAIVARVAARSGDPA